MNLLPPRPAKKIGRKRRAAGWMMLALGIIVAGVWVASARSFPRVRFGNWTFGVLRGLFHAIDVRDRPARFTPGQFPTFTGEDPVAEMTDIKVDLIWRHIDGAVADATARPGLLWHGETACAKSLRSFTPNSVLAVLPFWPLPLLLWPPAALLLRSGILARRRAMTGQCRKCGYSLAGLGEDAVCPECGKAKAIS